MDCRIVTYTLTAATGSGMDATRQAVIDRQSGLRHNDFEPSRLDTWIGRCEGADSYPWPSGDTQWQSRNNALAAVAVVQDQFDQQVSDMASRLGRHRVGVVIGTSTSSIGQTETAYRQMQDERLPEAYRQPLVHNPHSTANFIARQCQLTGPVITISTACSSSAKVFATAHRWIQAGLADAVVVGGVDSLCLSVLHGFNSLELTSRSACRPFDVRRDGISIGEAGGFALLVSATIDDSVPIRLSGYGESSDAHHMSHPHPEGLGARLAMSQALERSGLQPDEIDYVNLHGTATPANDLTETRALADLFPDSTPVSSTKGWTGHTLGAAGIVEAILAMDTLHTGVAPGTLNLEETDPELAFPVRTENLEGDFRHVMTNSFGFGGNNCSLIMSKVV
jgi:3-oxoacyl-[acyl-carrier-protein] synthase-1